VEISRRDFVHRVSIGIFTVYLVGASAPRLASATVLPDDIRTAKDPDNLQGLEKSHIPQVKVPMVAEDGRVVPIEMTLNHPMEKDHYITAVTIIVLEDPIASKGKFLFTPANGRPYLKFQARMAAGTSKVRAIIECSKHGKWEGDALIRIVGGGC
jgi:sulfur-oxidizing protein SoxY